MNPEEITPGTRLEGFSIKSQSKMDGKSQYTVQGWDYKKGEMAKALQGETAGPDSPKGNWAHD